MIDLEKPRTRMSLRWKSENVNEAGHHHFLKAVLSDTHVSSRRASTSKDSIISSAFASRRPR